MLAYLMVVSKALFTWTFAMKKVVGKEFGRWDFNSFSD